MGGIWIFRSWRKGENIGANQKEMARGDWFGGSERDGSLPKNAFVGDWWRNIKFYEMGILVILYIEFYFVCWFFKKKTKDIRYPHQYVQCLHPRPFYQTWPRCPWWCGMFLTLNFLKKKKKIVKQNTSLKKIPVVNRILPISITLSTSKDSNDTVCHKRKTVLSK